MNKIKVVGGLILILSIALALLSNSIARQNRTNILYIEQINHQKAFTQDIAKSILYIYQKRDSSSKALEDSINSFLKKEKNMLVNSDKSISNLWNRFYLKVSEFRKQQNILTPYSSIESQKLVNDIYNINIELIIYFDELIEKKERAYHNSIEIYKQIQRVLFAILIILLVYLFTQLHEVILFIQKFSKTSKNIIKNSTIKGVKPLDIHSQKEELKEITQNYNYLVKEIDISIENATNSIEQTTNSIEIVEKNIEDFLELVATMEDKRDDDIFKKEDVVIESLDTLIGLKDRLKKLKIELEELVK